MVRVWNSLPTSPTSNISTLAGTQIGDGDLHRLYGLLNLRHLDFTGTAVTAKGLEEIKRGLPDVEVEW
jgi:hypothetical protein